MFKEIGVPGTKFYVCFEDLNNLETLQDEKSNLQFQFTKFGRISTNISNLSLNCDQPLFRAKHRVAS